MSPRSKQTARAVGKAAPAATKKKPAQRAASAASKKASEAAPPLDVQYAATVAQYAANVATIPALLTVADMAALFGRSRSAIYRAVQEKRLPPPRDVGAGRRWVGREIADLISSAEPGR